MAVCLAVFDLCVPASLSLPFGFKGMLHRDTSLLSQVVVVVGEVRALGLGRSLSSGCHQPLPRSLQYGRFPAPDEDS